MSIVVIKMRLALYQPDIPQNTGAMLRLAACFAVSVDIIEPCGFVLDDARLKRAAMDYGGAVDIARHRSWDAFLNTLSPMGEGGARSIEREGEGKIKSPLTRPSGTLSHRGEGNRRLVLLSTKGSVSLPDFRFDPNDTILLGRESAGVPDDVHASCDARVVIPLAPGLRSLNVAQAAAIALYEALRQTKSLPS